VPTQTGDTIFARVLGENVSAVHFTRLFKRPHILACTHIIPLISWHVCTSSTFLGDSPSVHIIGITYWHAFTSSLSLAGMSAHHLPNR